MRRLAALVALVTALAGAFPSMAQHVCTTPYGNCVIASGTPAAGSPCYCSSAGGPLKGTVGGDSAAKVDTPAPVAKYCCTPAGRLGPYGSSTGAPGSACQGTLPNGTSVPGQACF